MNDEEQDRYIEIVAYNWTSTQYALYARLIRAHWYSIIWRSSGAEGRTFTALWSQTFSIMDEIELAGLATLMEHGA